MHKYSGSLWLIKSIYGNDVLTPDKGKIKCIETEKNNSTTP